MQRCYLCGQPAQVKCADCQRLICAEDRRTGVGAKGQPEDRCPPCDDERHRRSTIWFGWRP